MGLSQYLTRQVTAVLSATGAATVVLKPETGQYWLPRLYRVSTLTTAYPIASCTIYQGAVGVANNSTYLDDTNLGSGDTTSICAGTVLQFGDAITAVFTGGTPGDTAMLYISGVSTDTPPGIGELPVVPGTRFAGKAFEQVSLLSSIGTATTITAGNTVSVGPIDVRGYQAYYLEIAASAVGVPAQYDDLQVRLRWTDAVSGVEIFRDGMNFWADTAAGAFPVAAGPLYVQDNMHGPFMNFDLINGSPDSMSVTYRLSGTTRSLSGPFARQQGSVRGMLLDIDGMAIGAGVTQTYAMGFSYGRMRIRMGNSGVNAVNVRIRYASAVTQEFITLGGGTETIRELVVPKQSIWLVVGPPGGATTYSIFLATQYDKS